MIRIVTPVLSAWLFLGSVASAGDCTGDPGFALSITPDVAILGDPIDIKFEAPPGNLVVVMSSLGQGPTPTAFGELCLDFPPIFTVAIVMPPTGVVNTPSYMHCEPGFSGTAFYLQFVSVGPGGNGISNLASATGIDQGNGCNLCITSTKPAILRMRYTGKDCSASSHSQDPSAVTCSGDPMFQQPVRVVAQSHKTLGQKNAHVYFDGIVQVGQIFDLDAANAGLSRLKGETFLFVLDDEENVIHAVGFHTSCSQPLHFFDNYGAFELLAYIGE